MESRAQSLDRMRFSPVASWEPSTQPASVVRTGLGIGVVDCLIFAAPLLQVVQFKAGGVLFGTDLLLLAALPLVLALRPRSLSQRQILIILTLGVAWLFAQVLTDVFRDSDPADYLRGWSKIALTVSHFAVIWAMIAGSTRRFALYGIGACIGGALAVVVSPNELVVADPWKFGVGIPVTFGVVLAATLLSRKLGNRVVFLGLFTMAGVNLVLGFRSLGLICMVTGVFIFFRVQKGGRIRRLSRAQWMLVCVVLLLSAVGFMQFYKYAVVSGWLGVDAQTKYEAQGSGEGGLLLGGRSEILSSGQAIIDSPLIGHGSWAKDPKYADLLEERRAELGYKRRYRDEDDLIPTHSHLLGAWVEAGVVGAIFWFWILKMSVQALLQAIGTEPFLPVFAFIGFLLCWDILFSPYGAERRFLSTYFIAGIVMLRLYTARAKALAWQRAVPR